MNPLSDIHRLAVPPYANIPADFGIASGQLSGATALQHSAQDADKRGYADGNFKEPFHTLAQYQPVQL